MAILDRWFAQPDDPTPLLPGFYDPGLVVLSLAMAIFASGMALQIVGAGRRTTSRGVQLATLGAGSLALGCGVFSMHFIGMLAFDLCTRVDYDHTTTVLSMMPSIAASAVALTFIRRPRFGALQLPLAGVLVGGGIGVMHYSGMAAMRMAPVLRYDPFMFSLSILVAVVLAIVALWVRFGLGHWADRIGERGRLVLSAVVMGCAITGMHYTGMAAARFTGEAPPIPDDVTGSSFLALAVALISVAFVVFVGAANALLRYRLMVNELVASESRSRALLATAVDGVITLDRDGTIVDCNASAQRIFGRDRDALLGRGFSELIPEIAHAMPIVGEGREVTGVHRGGHPLPLRVAIGEAQLPDEKLFVAFVSDISERKAIEHALRDSEQQFRSLIGNIPGISYRCLAGDTWPMVFISDGVERLTGYPVSDFLLPHPVRGLGELVHPDDYGRIRSIVMKAIETGEPYLLEYRLIHRDGRVRWMWGHGGAVRDADGTLRWLDGVILDITERKQIELEVQKFRAIVASSDDAIISIALDGTISSWNRGAERLTGYAADEAIARPLAMLLPADRVDELPGALVRLADGEHLDNLETVWLRKDLVAIDVSATISPVRGDDGAVIGAAVIARDVTERRRMEAALLAAKERAEQSAAARTAFVANMSHEIRTPMNAILGFADVLAGTTLNAEQRRHLDILRSSARSLLRLLNDVLDTAKLERGAVELDPQDFNLLSLVDALSSTLGAQARIKGLQMHVRYAPGLPIHWYGDELRIRQVLTNLVGNAIKFTETGTVMLDVDRVDGDVHFTVSDTGIGISRERLEAIFEPFTQADASMTRRFGGTGLGTTISKQLVELMGGRLWADSEPGRGSVFHVVLPLQPGLRDVQPADDRAADLRLRPLRILAVDDVPQNRELLQVLLARHGHDVVVADDGALAVELAATQAFDLLLMDVMMPGMDGLDATRRIRAAEREQRRSRVPVIALTASVMDADRWAAETAGMDGFASKPIDVGALMAEIARVLGHRAMPLAFDAPDRAAATVLDAAAALDRWGGDLQAYRSALQRFIEQSQPAVARLQRLAADGAAMELYAEAHRLRGVAANVGLVELAAAMGAIERAARAGDAIAIEVARQQLHDQVVRAGAAIDQQLAQAPVGDRPRAPRRSREAVHAAHAALRAMLERGSIDDETIDGFIDVLPARTPAVDLLRRALEDFDFDAARMHMDAAVRAIEVDQPETET